MRKENWSDKMKFDYLSNFELILYKVVVIVISALALLEVIIIEVKSVIHVFGN